MNKQGPHFGKALLLNYARTRQGSLRWRRAIVAGHYQCQVDYQSTSFVRRGLSNRRNRGIRSNKPTRIHELILACEGAIDFEKTVNLEDNE